MPRLGQQPINHMMRRKVFKISRFDYCKQFFHYKMVALKHTLEQSSPLRKRHSNFNASYSSAGTVSTCSQYEILCDRKARYLSSTLFSSIHVFDLFSDHIECAGAQDAVPLPAFTFNNRSGMQP